MSTKVRQIQSGDNIVTCTWSGGAGSKLIIAVMIMHACTASTE